MELKIENFRSIKKNSFYFEDGITLLHGESGKGKTTVLEAISWCLYGGGRNILPFNSKSKEKNFVNVSIKLDNMLIYRSKPPDTVSVTVGDVVFVHDSAQKEIEKIFGTQNFWEASSYLKQDNRNILMSSSSLNKVAILKEIVFGMEGEQLIDDYYLKLNGYLEEKSKKVLELNAESEVLKGIFTKKSNLFGEYKEYRDKKYLKTYEKKDSIDKGITLLEEEKKKILKINVCNEEIKKKEIELEEIVEELKNFPDNLQLDTIEKWKKYSEAFEKKKLFRENFKTIDKNLEKEKEKLKDLQRETLLYSKNLKICQNLRIEYSKNYIDKELCDLEEKIEKIKDYKIYLERKENLNKIENNIKSQKEKIKDLENYELGLECPLWLEKEIEELSEALPISQKWEKWEKFKDFYDKLKKLEPEIIKNYKKLLEILKLDWEEFSPSIKFKILETIESCSGKYLECPGCNCFLVKRGEKLEKINFSPISNEEKGSLKNKLKEIEIFFSKLSDTEENMEKLEIQEEKPMLNSYGILEKLKYLKKSLKEYNNFKSEYSNETSKLQILKETLNSMEKLDEVEKEEGNIKIIKSRIEELRKIQFFEDKTLEESILEEELKELKKSEEFKRLSLIIKESYLEIFDKFKTPENFNKFFSKYKEFSEKYKIIKNFLKNNTFVENFKDEKEIEKKIELLKDRKEICENYKKYLEINEIEMDLEKVSDTFQKEVNSKSNTNSIKKIIDETLNETLENLIGELNESLNEISGELFEDIIIELEMFKKLKSKKDLKSQFNLLIHLKDNIYDNISFLSGGEKDRISISLTIAVSMLSSNPFILLDECMSSLDEEMRHKVINLIKKYVPHKKVINICHDSVIGFYDNVINF